MSASTLIRPEMAALVDRPYGRTVSYPIAASDIRKWAIAIHYPEPAPARHSGTDPIALAEFNPFAWGAAKTEPTGLEIEADPAHAAAGAMEHKLGVVPPDLRRALNGGVAVTYTGAAMRPGDVITAESAIAGYSEREGRLGQMLLTDVLTRWVNQDGEAVKDYRMTLIRY